MLNSHFTKEFTEQMFLLGYRAGQKAVFQAGYDILYKTKLTSARKWDIQYDFLVDMLNRLKERKQDEIEE